MTTSATLRGQRGRFIKGVADPSPDLGPLPTLDWLPLDALFVDDRYQRQITDDGIALINRIVREFRWSKFHPLLVAPVAAA